MNNQRAIWAVLVVIGIIGVLFLAPAIGQRPKIKAQASRIATVNRVSTVSMVITNTNASLKPHR